MDSYVRNGTIKSVKEREPGKQRPKTLILAEQKIAIYNVVILDALFDNRAKVSKIFTCTQTRKRSGQILDALIRNKDTLLGINLVKGNVDKLLLLLASDCDLYHVKLPNPFENEQLPQIVLVALPAAINSFVLSGSSEQTTIFLDAYLDDDIEVAYQNLPKGNQNQSIEKLKTIVTSRYDELVEFEKTLSLFE